MGYKLKPAPTGVTLPTSFVEDFAGADSNALGPQWVQACLKQNNGTCYNAAVKVNNRGRFVQLGTAGNAQTAAIVRPLMHFYDDAAPRSMFGEVRLSAQNSANWAAFLAVCASPNLGGGVANDGGYWLYFDSNKSLSLQRFDWSNNYAWDGGPMSNPTAIQNNIGTWDFGDLLRLEARWVSDHWHFDVLKNGVVLGSGTDATLARSGTAGFGGGTSLGGAWFEISHFAAGAL